jgi:hypothetical protein
MSGQTGIGDAMRTEDFNMSRQRAAVMVSVASTMLLALPLTAQGAPLMPASPVSKSTTLKANALEVRYGGWGGGWRGGGWGGGWRGGYGGWRGGWGGWGWGAGAVAAGALIGSAIAAPYYYGGYDPYYGYAGPYAAYAAPYPAYGYYSYPGYYRGYYRPYGPRYYNYW